MDAFRSSRFQAYTIMDVKRAHTVIIDSKLWECMHARSPLGDLGRLATFRIFNYRIQVYIRKIIFLMYNYIMPRGRARQRITGTRRLNRAGYDIRGRSTFPRNRVMKTVLYRSPKVHPFKRSCIYAGSVATAAAGTTYGNLEFQLDKLPNYAEFTSLFDQYRINCIVFKFIWRGDTIDPSATAGAAGPILYIASDIDDSANPAGVTELLEYGNHKIIPFGPRRMYMHKVYPKINKLGMTGTGYVSGVVPKAKCWLDCSTPTIEHNCAKYAINNPGTVSTQTFDIIATAYLQCKNPR